MARVLVFLTLLTNGRAAAEPPAAAEAMSAFRRGARALASPERGGRLADRDASPRENSTLRSNRDQAQARFGLQGRKTAGKKFGYLAIVRH